MKTPHKHAELIKAWADGAIIQCRHNTSPEWKDVNNPSWVSGVNYRVKPEPQILEGFAVTIGMDGLMFVGKSEGTLNPRRATLTIYPDE